MRSGEGDENVELVCLVRGHPHPHVTWTKDGRPIKLNQHIRQTQTTHRHTLRISNVSRRDFGTYLCIADNTQGKDSEVIQLTG